TIWVYRWSVCLVGCHSAYGSGGQRSGPGTPRGYGSVPSRRPRHRSGRPPAHPCADTRAPSAGPSGRHRHPSTGGPMAPYDPLFAAGLTLTLLLLAAPVAVARGGGEDFAYDLGHRVGQITADLLIAAVILGAMLGGAALVRRVRRRRAAGPPA